MKKVVILIISLSLFLGGIFVPVTNALTSVDMKSLPAGQNAFAKNTLSVNVQDYDDTGSVFTIANLTKDEYIRELQMDVSYLMKESTAARTSTIVKMYNQEIELLTNRYGSPLDANSPVIEDGSYKQIWTNKGTYLLTGKALPGEQIVVNNYWRITAETVAGNDGTFSVEIPLYAGKNHIWVEAIKDRNYYRSQNDIDIYYLPKAKPSKVIVKIPGLQKGKVYLGTMERKKIYTFAGDVVNGEVELSNVAGGNRYGLVIDGEIDGQHVHYINRVFIQSGKLYEYTVSLNNDYAITVQLPQEVIGATIVLVSVHGDIKRVVSATTSTVIFDKLPVNSYRLLVYKGLQYTQDYVWAYKFVDSKNVVVEIKGLDKQGVLLVDDTANNSALVSEYVRKITGNFLVPVQVISAGDTNSIDLNNYQYIFWLTDDQGGSYLNEEIINTLKSWLSGDEQRLLWIDGKGAYDHLEQISSTLAKDFLRVVPKEEKISVEGYYTLSGSWNSIFSGVVREGSYTTVLPVGYAFPIELGWSWERTIGAYRQVSDGGGKLVYTINNVLDMFDTLESMPSIYVSIYYWELNVNRMRVFPFHNAFDTSWISLWSLNWPFRSWQFKTAEGTTLMRWNDAYIHSKLWVNEQYTASKYVVVSGQASANVYFKIGARTSATTTLYTATVVTDDRGYFTATITLGVSGMYEFYVEMIPTNSYHSWNSLNEIKVTYWPDITEKKNYDVYLHYPDGKSVPAGVRVVIYYDDFSDRKDIKLGFIAYTDEYGVAHFSNIPVSYELIPIINQKIYAPIFHIAAYDEFLNSYKDDSYRDVYVDVQPNDISGSTLTATVELHDLKVVVGKPKVRVMLIKPNMFYNDRPVAKVAYTGTDGAVVFHNVIPYYPYKIFAGDKYNYGYTIEELEPSSDDYEINLSLNKGNWLIVGYTSKYLDDYVNAFEMADIGVATYTLSDTGTINQQYMKSFAGVVWDMSEEYNVAPYVELLIDYLNSGGRLWIAGDKALPVFSEYAPYFAKWYMGVKSWMDLNSGLQCINKQYRYDLNNISFALDHINIVKDVIAAEEGYHFNFADFAAGVNRRGGIDLTYTGFAIGDFEEDLDSSEEPSELVQEVVNDMQVFYPVVNITATVENNNLNITLSGDIHDDVVVYVDTATYAVDMSSGSSTLTIPNISSGYHYVFANYGYDKRGVSNIVTVFVEPPKTTVSGSVTLNGQPVEGASVRLVSDDGKFEYMAVTDNQGKFTISDVYTGTYTIYSEKASINARGYTTVYVKEATTTYVSIALSTPPTVDIISPNDGATVSATGTIEVIANVTDKQNDLVKVVVYVDDVPEQEFTHGGTITMTFDAAKYTAGEHEVKFVASDKVDNETVAYVHIIVESSTEAVSKEKTVQWRIRKGINLISVPVKVEATFGELMGSINALIFKYEGGRFKLVDKAKDKPDVGIGYLVYSLDKTEKIVEVKGEVVDIDKIEIGEKERKGIILFGVVGEGIKAGDIYVEDSKGNRYDNSKGMDYILFKYEGGRFKPVDKEEELTEGEGYLLYSLKKMKYVGWKK